jgi:hypothetical protein
MESIGFTMMCVFLLFFFVSGITFCCSKNVSIFLNSNFSARKVNVDGKKNFGQVKNQTFSIFFKNIEKTIKKKYENNGIFTQNHVLANYIFFKML